MAFMRDNAKFPRLRTRHLMLSAVLAAFVAGGLAGAAEEQPPPSSQAPGTAPENGGKGTFKREDGVVRPPGDIDPQMVEKPHDGSRTPVIPPPGTPGGQENVHPK